MFISMHKINNFTTDDNSSFFKQIIVVDDLDQYLILRFEIPEQFRNEKMYISILGFSKFHFMDDNVLLLDDIRGIVDIKGREIVDVLLSTDVPYTTIINIEFFFIKTPKSDLIISHQEEISFKLIPNIFNSFLIPFYYGRTSIKFLIINDYYENDRTLMIRTEVGNYSFYSICSYFSEVDLTAYLTSAGIGELEPYVVIDFSNYKPLVDKEGNFTFSVNAQSCKKIRMERGSFTDSQPLIDKKANFIIDDVSSPITFHAVCHNETEKACEIEYPAPSQTGFHLLRFPNRDGISITGRGFYAEAIPVEKGKSFIYYKTYVGVIEKYREYSSDPVKIKVKVIDERNANYENMKRVRRICLEDSTNNLVPFSRKYIEENMEELINRLCISKDIDMNYFTNDENGCIVFDPKYIESNDLKNFTNDFCDLNVDGQISELDKKKMIFSKGGEDKDQKTKTIILAVGIPIIIIVIIVVYCIIKKKRCKKLKNNSTDQEKSDEIVKESNNL